MENGNEGAWGIRNVAGDEGQSLLLHTLQAARRPTRALTPLSAVSSVSGHNGGQTTTEQPSNEKTTAYRTNTSKQKKTSEEKQAEKKESDRATLETSWSTAEREGEGPGSCIHSNFKFQSPLSSQSYRLLL